MVLFSNLLHLFESLSAFSGFLVKGFSVGNSPREVIATVGSGGISDGTIAKIVSEDTIFISLSHEDGLSVAIYGVLSKRT